MERERDAVRLIESLRWDGRLHRVDRHLRRMEASARRLGFSFAEGEARRALSALVGRLDADPPRKVRLTLGRDGGLELEAVRLEPLPDPVPALLADVRTDPDDDLLYHKTDRRRSYEEARRRAARRGYREVVFRNLRGEVTEGTFTNVFVRSGDAWSTPPVASGLLPGVYRGVLLERLDGARERVLRPADLAAADEMRLCNSVRGSLRARLTPAGGDDAPEES